MTFHVRRKDRKVTDQAEMRQVLKSTKYVTIALRMDNEPYLVSLSHDYDEAENCLYSHCAPEGKKLTYLKSNNKVLGQTVLDYGVTDKCDYAYVSVHFSGKFVIVDDLKKNQHAIEVLVRQLSANPAEKLAKIKPEKLAATTIGKISLQCLTGKKHQNPK